MIAMALAGDPTLLIADEPTTALDVTIQAQILELIEELRQERGLAMILITHDLGIIAQTADNVAVMYAGKIVEYTDVKTLFAEPKHPYTVGLLAAVHDLRPIPGEIVFENEPVIRVEGTIIETQLVESLLLNIINFQSLIATKASRIRQSACNRIVIDFGLRRAQGLSAIHASKAAVIGGFDATSNEYASLAFGIKASGTQAHSWIQSYPDELTAFRKYAKAYPKNCVFLVDTYDTLNSGIPNTIIAAKEMEKAGEKLLAIRLDSGDLAYLSKKTRKLLDDAGLDYVKIFVSNQLNEYLIKSLLEQGAPIDGFGVGTELITGQPDAALDGVYKLGMVDSNPSFKLSENLEKVTLPGVKKIHRYINGDGKFYADGILLDEEDSIDRIFHPSHSHKSADVQDKKQEELLELMMKNGEIKIDNKSVKEISEYRKYRLSLLPDEHKRFENPHTYKIGISKKLGDLRNSLIAKLLVNK